MSNQRARSYYKKKNNKRGRRRNVRPLNAIDVASKICEALNTPVALKIYLCIKHGEFEQVARAGVDPANYMDDKLPFLGLHWPGIATFMADYQAVSILAKYEMLPTGIDTEKVAMKKFIESELACKDTNDRIRCSSHVENPRVSSVLHRAQRKIASILGDVPTYAELKFKFGPGANYGIKSDTSQYAKLNHGLECTHALIDTLPEFLGEFPGWFPSQDHATVRLAPGSRLTFVPKNAKTDRPICIEPCLNTLFQKGVGSYIRSRLARWGVNLRDQTLNQVLAKNALARDLATVDFASASDTISYLLVYDLLPPDWATFLDQARSPNYEIEGGIYSFQKFSSMGNAYTFELESLIFFALAISCCEELEIPWACGLDGNLAVYGDDVVIPSSAFALFSECAVSCGFSINTEKTYSSGIFYESCGKDYFNGTDVRPLFIKKDPAVRRELGVYYVANQIKRWTERFSSASDSDVIDARIPALLNAYWYVVDHIAETSRLYGPEGFGDGHLVIDAADVYEPHPDGWDGYIFYSRVTMPELITPVLTDEQIPEWPMHYALYTSAYGDAQDDKDHDSVKRHEYDVDWDLLRAHGISPQFSLGYHVRGRNRVKKAALYASRKALSS